MIHHVLPLLNTNYAGHFPSSDLLPVDGLTQPSWALVGPLTQAEPWFFYVEPTVPVGYAEGWNNLQSLLGTYDLTANVISIADRFLLTEYNVSRLHTQNAYIYAPSWQRIPYAEEFPLFQEGTVYRRGFMVRVADFTECAFRAVCAGSDIPVVMRIGTNRFSLSTAILATPEAYRLLGMRLTFVSVYTAQSETWFFTAPDVSLWEDTSHWQRIYYDAEPNQLTVEDAAFEEVSLPLLVADRAIADSLGREIVDTYLTKEAAAAFIQQQLTTD